MKYSPGDPVWAKHDSYTVELAAVIIRFVKRCGADHDMYEVDSAKESIGYCCEPYLRPRRDDYQQHEGLGSRDKLTEPVSDNTLCEAELERICEEAYQRTR